MSGKIGLVDVLHHIPAHMQEGSHILDGAYTEEFGYKSTKTIGISAFACDKMKVFLTDGTAILAFDTLDLHL